MDFTIWRNAGELRSTCYVEVAPGPYTGEHWRDGSIYVEEVAFTSVEGLLQKHLPTYSHFSPNDLPRSIGTAVIADWREAASKLPGLSGTAAYEALHLDDVALTWKARQVARHREQITLLLLGLAAECERFYEQADTLRILGM